MKYNIVIALLLASCMSNNNGNGKENIEEIPVNGETSSSIDPANTYVFIAGVLKWQDPSLASFNNKNRKDEELYNLLLSKGVKKVNTVYLKDQEATLDNMNNRLQELLRKTTPGSTFIFYYAGHGVRSGNNPVSFANYDYNSAGKEFRAATVSEQINSLFKGRQVMLLADCCYSGALLDESKEIGTKGKAVITFTSSTSSNISTANWTFTQTIIDCLSGVGVCDRNNDGAITLGEVKNELYDAMRYRERQLSGAVFYNTSEATPFNMGKVQSVSVKPATVQYIYVMQGDKFEPARVMKQTGSTITGELYHYSDKETVTIPASKTKEIAFADYPVGKEVQVEWEGANYPAVIKEAKNGFHYIHYAGYDNSWDEWVTYDRITTTDRKECSVEWQGQWYPAEMLQQKGTKYLVHYTGYGNDWDEWVGKERIRL